MARRESVVEEEPRTRETPRHQAQAQAGTPALPAETPAPQQSAAAADAPVQTAAVPMPPPLGKVPTSIKQLVPSNGLKATHFLGPVVSGPPPGSAGMGGAALDVLALQLDYSMGNFSLPIQFPPGAVLLWFAASQYQAFTAEPDVALGRTAGAGDIMAATPLPAAPDNQIYQPILAGALPFPWETNPGQAFLNVTLNTGNTAGGAILLFGFALIPRPWN